jgi:hypothetical protein
VSLPGQIIQFIFPFLFSLISIAKNILLNISFTLNPYSMKPFTKSIMMKHFTYSIVYEGGQVDTAVYTPGTLAAFKRSKKFKSVLSMNKLQEQTTTVKIKIYQ